HLGLERISGEVSFNDMTIDILRAPRGETFFSTGFEGPHQSPISGVVGSQYGDIGFSNESHTGNYSLFVHKSNTSVATMGSISMPVKGIEGHTLYLSGWIKAENISRPTSYHGIKFMAKIIPSSGDPIYAQPKIPIDEQNPSFDWKKFSVPFLIPDDVKYLNIQMGLQGVSGTVWFDDVKITIGREPFKPLPAVPEDTPIYTGHSQPRLRGAHINPYIYLLPDAEQEYIRTLKEEWNANLIRYSFHIIDPKERMFSIPAS
ncbi:hypothetical protein THIOM_002561, partial [Candidatus Thiomargarita nelsonii]